MPTDSIEEFPGDQADGVPWHVTTVPIGAPLEDGALIRFAVLVDDTASVFGDIFIDDVKVLPDPSCL